MIDADKPRASLLLCHAADAPNGAAKGALRRVSGEFVVARGVTPPVFAEAAEQKVSFSSVEELQVL